MALGGELVHAMLRGIVGAMAMSGARVAFQHGGLIERTPPQAIAKERARGLMRSIPRRRRAVAVELIHWSVGALGGASYALAPEALRRRPWSGPAFGLAILLSYEFTVAPALGLSHAGRRDAREQAAFVADHLLYGLVLSEGHRHSRAERAEPAEG